MMRFYLPTFLPSLKQGAYIRFASQLSMSTFRHATRPIEARTLLGKVPFFIIRQIVVALKLVISITRDLLSNISCCSIFPPIKSPD